MLVNLNQKISGISSHTLCLKKMHCLWNGIAQNYSDRFWWYLAEIFKSLQNRVCMFQFSCRFAFYPRNAMLARVIAIATCLSVRPSVCHAPAYCVKTKKASDMISSPSGSPKTLVFWRQISSPNSKGFPPNGGLKQGSVWKIQRFSTFKRQYLENGSRYGQSYY